MKGAACMIIVSLAQATSLNGAGHPIIAKPACVEVSCLPSFEQHKIQFSLSYPASELPMRKTLYEERLRAIVAHNMKVDQLWSSGVNSFAAATPMEFAAMLGYTRQQRGSDAVQLLQSSFSSKPSPSDFDWRNVTPSVVTAVKSQGACGSCWAFTAAEVLESVIAIQTGTLMSLSPQQLNSCTPNPDMCGGAGGCTGATADLAFNYTVTAGITTEWHWPYMSGITAESGACFDADANYNYGVRLAGITGYRHLPRNDDIALKAAVLLNPVAVSVAASTWGMYDSGIFHGCDNSNPVLNHAVALMGYGEVNLGTNSTAYYWLVRNSWGVTWGEHGYVRLQRFPEGEPCGVDTKPLDGYSCAKQPPANVTACGECGILSDSSYPTGAFLGPPETPEDPAVSTTETMEDPVVNTTETPEDQVVSTTETVRRRQNPVASTTESPTFLFP